MAVLVGATLVGPAGAFVAVPAAAIVDILVREVVVPWRRDQIPPDDQDPMAVRVDGAVRAGPRAAAR